MTAPQVPLGHHVQGTGSGGQGNIRRQERPKDSKAVGGAKGYVTSSLTVVIVPDVRREREAVLLRQVHGLGIKTRLVHNVA